MGIIHSIFDNASKRYARYFMLSIFFVDILHFKNTKTLFIHHSMNIIVVKINIYHFYTYPIRFVYG